MALQPRALSKQTNCSITSLPCEIISSITDHLDQADIKCLLQTCRNLVATMTPIMMRRDIDDGIYNSLSWACYFGDAAIGRRCLDMGASPDAAFLHDPDRRLLPFQRKPNWPDTYERGLTGYSYEVTVHPTRKLGRIPLFYPVLDSHACCFILFHMKLKQSLDPDSYETVTPPVSYVSVGFICFIYAR